MQFQPAKEQNIRNEVISLFSFLLKSINFQPQNRNFKDFCSNVNIRKDKHQLCFSSRKFCVKLSANQMVKTALSDLFQIHVKKSGSGQLAKGFLATTRSLLSFCC
jgi:hypothetical protein